MVMKMSNLELHILKILKQEGIPFVREKTFSDLRKNKYRFDFYLPKQNVLIEINGAQHYENISFFYKNRIEFKKAQERDRRKISYALANEIPLYIIPHWEIQNIKNSKQIFQKKFLATSKYHNDNIVTK